MVSEAVFAEGMTRLSVAFGDEAQRRGERAWAMVLKVYREALSEMEDAGFQAAVGRCLKSERRFPSPSALVRDFGRASRLAAAEAFEAVKGLRKLEYGVRSWDKKAIQAQCGDAAAEAFLVAGGNEAFQEGEDNGFVYVRRAFVEHYLSIVRDEVSARARLSSEGAKVQLVG